ncbi:uncharacterized protein T26G10.4-like [Ctenocephalides felis]|uniref:uncharacterized protein T26G10.4-like n=1 Tax=Ctenocephalides felis TaxID=7515 RepID=UPI000E6E374C|nr:uncharacterized protein T26G10.4-like [Ctenocephalides felis]
MDTTATVSKWSGLQFNTRKCATLHVDGKQHRAITTTFSLNGETMKTLDMDQSYEYLGIPTGFQSFSSADEVIRAMRRHAEQLNNSLLAPWQKVDALNTFIMPQLQFHLRNGKTTKKLLWIYDREVKTYAKKWANLPKRASAEILYLAYKEGGFNLLPTSFLADIGQVVHAHRLLTSNDDSVAEASLAALKEVVRKKTIREATPKELVDYINGSDEGLVAKPSNDISSTWTRLRAAARRLKGKINFLLELDSLQVDDKRVERQNSESALRTAARNHFRNKLILKPDQGKAMEVTSANSVSNHFIRDGSFTRFADWRFIHRARLNVLPLNGCRRFGQNDKRCRRCGHQNETLPHVLNHCRPQFATMTKRHNAILNRLTKAMKVPPGSRTFINQQIPGFIGTERPDVVI